MSSYRGKVLFGGIKIWRAVEIPTLDEEHPLVELGDQQGIAASLSLSLSLTKNGTDDWIAVSFCFCQGSAPDGRSDALSSEPQK